MAECTTTVDIAIPIDLCTTHLLVAYDWVAKDVGVTDALPTPCLVGGSRVGIRYPSHGLCAVCGGASAISRMSGWLPRESTLCITCAFDPT